MSFSESAQSPSAQPAAKTDKSKPMITAEQHTLANGLKVIILPSGAAPIVSIGMLIGVGTADDPSNEVGLSHFLEHMMFKGTKKVPGDQFTKRILQHGGNTNALTSYDYTLYYTTIAADKLAFILELEADRLCNLSFARKEVESERKVVQEERRMRLDNNPMGVAYEAYLRAFHMYHPYGVTPIGFPQHIDAYTYESVHAHYRKWYQPNNVTLLITGCTSMKEALPIIEKHFGHIPAAKSIPARKRISNPPRDGITQTITQYNKRNSLIILYWFYDAPTFKSTDGKKHYYALKVLEELMSNNTTEFYTTLVEKKKLALSVSSSYSGNSIDPQDFSIAVNLAPNMDLDAVKKELKNRIANIIKNGVSVEELTRIKNSLITSMAGLKDGTNKYLSGVAAQLGVGKTIDNLNEYEAKIEAVTVDDIEAAAEYVLGKDPVVSLEMFPEKK